MEFLFILISIVASFGLLSLIPFIVYGNWKDTKRALKRQFTEDDGVLGVFYIFMGVMLAFVFLITFCAMNNTFWHFDYWMN